MQEKRRHRPLWSAGAPRVCSNTKLILLYKGKHWEFSKSLRTEYTDSRAQWFRGMGRNRISFLENQKSEEIYKGQTFHMP